VGSAQARSDAARQVHVWHQDRCCFKGKSLEGVRFLRQKAFGRYIVDFYCSSAKLVIELDGTVHDTPEAQTYDAIRTETLEARGLQILRFRNEIILEQLPEVVKKIKEIIRPQLV
jgi:very-short-patch-repair endonuclease